MTTGQADALIRLLERLAIATEGNARIGAGILGLWEERSARDAAETVRSGLGDRMTTEANRASLAAYDAWMASR